VTLFKESESLIEKSDLDTLAVDLFQNEYCDA
jgi:hypothetical protein